MAQPQGAAGVVLFNRFYQPDIDLESLEVTPNILLSTPMAMRIPLRWIAILRDQARNIVLPDEVVQVVVRLQNHVAAAPAIAAARAALGPELLPLKRNAAASSVPGAGEDQAPGAADQAAADGRDGGLRRDPDGDRGRPAELGRAAERECDGRLVAREGRIAEQNMIGVAAGLATMGFGEAPAMLRVNSMVSETLSSNWPGMMLKSLRLMLKLERMTSRSPLRSGTRWPSLSFR